jgi:hypothetical protein
VDKYDPFGVIQAICEIYTLGVAGIFLLPVLFLIVVQVRNLVENKTTYERYSYKKPVSRKSAEKSEVKELSVKHKLSEPGSYKIQE